MANIPLAERLRPRTLDDYIGQAHLVGPNGVFRKFLETGNVPSFILWGPPGVGKTSLAKLVAAQLERSMFTLSAVTAGVKEVREVIESARRQQFFNSRPPFLFIDEIHRLSPIVEEYLYSAMEDYKIDIVLDKGPSARSIQIELAPFTLIGATTRSGLLTSPLRARFGISCHLEYYDAPVLAGIVHRSARILDVPIDEEAAHEVALRSRGTPRIANALLRRVRDFAMVKGDGRIDLAITRTALEALNIDSRGLDRMDNKILGTIIEKFRGGPVGLNTIATAVGEEAGTVEEVYEPFLIKEGFLKRTPRGREATELAYRHLGLAPHDGGETGRLF